MLNRRSFLGSVLGSVVTLPFLARLECQEWQMPDTLPYKMLFRGNGRVIQAPAMASITKEAFGARFLCSPLHVCQAIQVDSAILLTDKGKVVSEGKFYSPIYMTNGDTLTVNYHLETGAPVSLEELVEICMKYPRKDSYIEYSYD